MPPPFPKAYTAVSSVPLVSPPRLGQAAEEMGVVGAATKVGKERTTEFRSRDWERRELMTSLLTSLFLMLEYDFTYCIYSSILTFRKNKRKKYFFADFYTLIFVCFRVCLAADALRV